MDPFWRGAATDFRLMPSVNKVILIGNLGRDPELRVTPKGTQIATFSIAVNREWKNDSGEKQEEVTWVDIEAWGKQADTIAKYMHKGRSIYLEGRLRLDQWEDKNTKEKRSRMKVVLENFQFLGEAKQDAAPPPTQAQPPQNQSAAAPKKEEAFALKTPEDEPDIPF